MGGPWLPVGLTFACGILLGNGLRPHPVLALGLLVGVAVAALLTSKRPRLQLALLLTAVALAGMSRLAFAATVERGTVWAWQGRTATLVGTLAETPHAQGQRWVALLAAEQVESDGQGAGVRGRVWVQWKEQPAPALQAGARVRVTGRLDLPPVAVHPGDFDQAAYLRAQGASLWLKAVDRGQALGQGLGPPGARWLAGQRVAILARMERFWPGEPGALLRAVVFGERVDLNRDVVDDFRVAGAYALLAVSGLNVAAVAGLVMGLLILCRVRRTHAAGVAVLAVLAYALLTSGGASVWRAALMGVVGLLALALGWRRSPWEALGFAVLALLAAQPFTLFTPAFQLSCGGVLGIFLWQKRLHTWLAPAGRRAERLWQRVWWHVAGGLAVGAAAQLALTPLLLYWFGEFAALGLPVGLVGDLWLLGCLAATGVGLVGGGLPGVLGLALRWPAGALAKGALWLTHAAAQVPGGFWRPGPLGLGWTLAAYGAITAVDLWLRRREPWALVLRQRWGTWLFQRRRVALHVGVAGVLLLAAVGCAARIGAGDLRLYMLNVGQGEALLLRLPGPRPHWWLIDGGPAPVADSAHDHTVSGVRQDEGEAVVLPALRRLGVERLDVVVLSHPHQDHAGGLAAILDAMPVGEVWDTGFDMESPGYRRVMTTVQALGIPVHQPKQGEVLVDLAGGVTIRVLWPTPGLMDADPNQHSIVLQVVYGETSWLLMGCAGTVVEEQLQARYGDSLRADFLKVGHHGSQTSTAAAFLQTTKPTLALISAGAGNSFGHPDVRLLNRLRGAEVLTARTDTGGTLEVASDGQRTRLVRGRPGLPASLGARPGERRPPLLGAW